MMIAAMLAFLHFVAIFGIAATLVLELVMLTPTPTPDQVWKMQLCDRWYGVFAAVVLLIGVLRIAYFERGWGLLWIQSLLLREDRTVCVDGTDLDLPDDSLHPVE